MASDSSRTITITIQDAPPKPDILRITLKDKSMWQSFCESAKGFTPSKLMELFDAEKKKLLDKVKSGCSLTQEECDFLNKNTRENLERVLEEFKQKVLAQVEVKPTDNPDELQFKMSFAAQLIKWLGELFSWVLDKINQIFAKLKEAFQWCVKKARELLQYLWSLF